MTASTEAGRVAERSPWRWPAAATALVIAVAHVPITKQHLSEAPYIGWSFVALEITAVLLATVLATRDTAAVWRAAVVVPAGAIVAYLVTRSVALPLIGDDVGNWTEPLSYVALAAEVLLIVIAAAHRSWSERQVQLAPGLRLLAGLLLVLGLAATGWAAAVSSG